MNKRLGFTLTLMVGLVILAGLASAKEDQVRPPLPEMQIMTVDEAVVQALIHNPALRAARWEIGMVEGDVISASLLANPSIAAIYGREKVRERDRMTGAITRSHTHSWDFSVSQDISIAGARPLRLLVSRAELDRVKADVARQEIDLMRNLKHSIAEYMANSTGTAHLHNVVYGVKPLMWELTKNAPEDQGRAKMTYQDIQQETRNDRQERMEIEAELNGWLGFPQQTRVLIKDTLEPQPIPISYEELRQTIMSRNLDVKTALAVIRSARYGLKLAEVGVFPTVTGSFEYIKSREITPDARAIHRERDYGLDTMFPLFDQNQGGIHSAKATLGQAQDQLVATKWDVEEELYKLYKDLELLHVRIRSFEYGYLNPLEKILYEDDLGGYQDNTIKFADWEQDLKRYHIDGDQLLEVKVEYKEAMADLEFLAGGSFTTPSRVPQESPWPEGKPRNYCAGLGLKAGRGLSNILLSPIELPASICGNIHDRGIWGVIVGPFDGVLTAVERAAAGVTDVVTAPVPWPLEGMEPVSEPIWDKNPWTGSWSLRYFHPPYKNHQHYFDPAYKQADRTAEGGK